MSKPFRKGLVVGSFSPFHLGHEALIECAYAHCEQVVIVGYNATEHPKHSRADREMWIKGRFPQAEVLVVDHTKLYDMRATNKLVPSWIPGEHDSREMHSTFVACVLLHVLGTTVDGVFTSDQDGFLLAQDLEYFFSRQLSSAPRLAVKHVGYDLERKNFPFTCAELRADVYKAKSHVSSNVYASLMPRLVIMGDERSGKTSLAKALASELDTAWVSEFRKDELAAKNGELRYEDMLKIAKTQVTSERVLARRFGNKMLICDTSPLFMRFYSTLKFGMAHRDVQRLSKREYDIHVLCRPLDGTTGMHEMLTGYYQEFGGNWLTVDGTVEERVHQVREFIGM